MNLHSGYLSTSVLTFLALGLSACTHSSAPSVATAEDRPVAPAISVTPPPASGLKLDDLSKGLPAGASIPVRLRTVLDTTMPTARFAVGDISGDVKGSDGRIALPDGSTATLAVREMGRSGAISTLKISIYSVNALGKQFSFSDGREEAAHLEFTEDAGNGSAHTAVHLPYGFILNFKLDRAVRLQ